MEKIIRTSDKIKEMQKSNRIWVCLDTARSVAEKLNFQFVTNEFTVVKVVEQKTGCEYGYTVVSAATM